MSWLIRFLALTLVLLCGTWWAGWWCVPVAAAAFGAWSAHQRSAVLTATLASACAWGALLAYDATVGPVGRLLAIFGQMLRMPGGMIAVLTIAFAALLGASASALARGIRRLIAPT